jgi:hypothetical protein
MKQIVIHEAFFQVKTVLDEDHADDLIGSKLVCLLYRRIQYVLILIVVSTVLSNNSFLYFAEAPPEKSFIFLFHLLGASLFVSFI